MANTLNWSELTEDEVERLARHAASSAIRKDAQEELERRLTLTGAKPCPWCQATNPQPFKAVNGGRECFTYLCTQCGASGPVTYEGGLNGNAERARVAWNDRKAAQ